MERGKSQTSLREILKLLLWLKLGWISLNNHSRLIFHLLILFPYKINAYRQSTAVSIIWCKILKHLHILSIVNATFAVSAIITINLFYFIFHLLFLYLFLLHVMNERHNLCNGFKYVLIYSTIVIYANLLSFFNCIV